jgi:hypothetical protein
VRDADDAVRAAAGFLGVVRVAIFVLIIIFLYRAVKNTETWDSVREKWTPGWAIGGWFIPFANLVIPLLLTRETWRRSVPAAEVSTAPSTAIVSWWWVLFIVGSIAVEIDPGNDTYNDIKTRDGFGIGGSVLLAVSAILLIVIVRRLAKWQHNRANAATRV